jgi:hypothetical protein
LLQTQPELQGGVAMAESKRPSVYAKVEVSHKASPAETKRALKELVDKLDDAELQKFQGGRLTIIA